ncbi:MAG: T9SS type A sorting domain-containing protein, partial [Saprospiraceae bacterium]
INISSDVNMDNVNIQLFDMAGREVSETINTNIISGENQLILSTQNLSLGTYIVSVRSEKGQRSIKVLVR